MNILTDGSSLKKIKISACCFMGLAHLIYLKDYFKGIFFALIETVFIVFLPSIIQKIIDLVTLGSPHPELPVKLRDNSIFMLIDGILVISLVIIFFVVYFMSISSAEKTYKEYCRAGVLKNWKASMNHSLGSSFPVFGLAPAFVMVIVFVVVPLVFSVAVAFTNYSDPGHIPPNNTVDWVGFQNFVDLLSGQNT